MKKKSKLTVLARRQLIKALTSDDVAKLESLRAKGWTPQDDIRWEGAVFTPLQAAIDYRSIKIVRYLLESGVDPNRDRFRWTPLMQAVDIECEGIVDLLLAHRADVNITSLGTWNERGETALIGACHRGNLRIAEKLLAAGADPSLATADGRNTISEAINAGNEALVRRLLNAGARPLASALIPPVRKRSYLLNAFSDETGELPKEQIAKHMDFIKMALSYKPSLDIRFKLDGDIVKTKGDTLLGCAARGGDIEVVKILIAAGADVNALTIDNPPIVMAASNNHPEIVKLLIQAGADIEAVSVLGRTALATAVDRGHLECVKLLRGQGASPQRKGLGPLARSAVELAREKANPEFSIALG